MKNKIILSTILMFIFLGSFSFVQAVSGPELAVNDSLKKCQVYTPNNREELRDGWKNSNNYDWKNWEKYCESIGYEWNGGKATKLTTPELIKFIGTWIIFLGLIFASYILLVKKNKRYILFIVSIPVIYSIVWLISNFKLLTTY